MSLSFRSAISSSMLAVAIGSSAEVGSSNSRISGSVASARAMHRRCCWPPERLNARSFRRSLTSSHSAAPRSACSTFSSSDRHPALAAHAQAVGHVLVDRFGKRVGLLEHHADAHAHLDRVDLRVQQIGVVGIQPDLALVAVARVEVVHAVEAAQVGRLAAAGRADQGRHLLLVQRHVDVLQRMEVARSGSSDPWPPP